MKTSCKFLGPRFTLSCVFFPPPRPPCCTYPDGEHQELLPLWLQESHPQSPGAIVWRSLEILKPQVHPPTLHKRPPNPRKHLRSPGEAKTKLRFKPKSVDGAVMYIRPAVLGVAPGTGRTSSPQGLVRNAYFWPLSKGIEPQTVRVGPSLF